MSLVIEESDFTPTVEKFKAASKSLVQETSWNGHNISTEESAVDSKIREFKALLNKDWIKGASWAWLPGCVALLVISAQMGASLGSPLILIPSITGIVIIAYQIFRGDDENKEQLLKSFNQLNQMVGNNYPKDVLFIDNFLGIPGGLKAPRDMKTRLEFLRSIYFTRGLFNNLLAVIFTIGLAYGTWMRGVELLSYADRRAPGSWTAFLENGLPISGILLICALFCIGFPAGVCTDSKMIVIGGSAEKLFEDLKLAIRDCLGQRNKASVSS